MVYRKLDRVYQHDPRSLAEYPIRTLRLDAPVTKSWDVNAFLDQGSEGACVGFGFGHELNADPQPVACDGNCARSIYHRAQNVDEWDGNSYDGTSVLAGAKIVTADGFYDEYRWGETEDDMARALAVGPVVIGVDWHNDMFEPDANGFIHPTGGVAGGHCILVKGINVESGYYIVHNSWGEGWGDHGTAKITRTDMAFLLRNQGEVCLPVRSSNVDPTPVDPTDPVEPTPEPQNTCGFWCKLWQAIKEIFGL